MSHSLLKDAGDGDRDAECDGDVNGEGDGGPHGNGDAICGGDGRGSDGNTNIHPVVGGLGVVDTFFLKPFWFKRQFFLADPDHDPWRLM